MSLDGDCALGESFTLLRRTIASGASLIELNEKSVQRFVQLASLVIGNVNEILIFKSYLIRPLRAVSDGGIWIYSYARRYNCVKAPHSASIGSISLYSNIL